MTNHTLAQLDAMPLEQAQALPFAERDALLDLIIADGRGNTTDLASYRTGLYNDYFQEDLLRLLKVRAVKIHIRGTTPSDFAGEIIGDTPQDQYRAAFRHAQASLRAAGTTFARVTTLVIFLTDMTNWPPPQPNLRRIHPQPPLPRRHRHHRPSPTPPLHRNRQLHRLPRSTLSRREIAHSERVSQKRTLATEPLTQFLAYRTNARPSSVRASIAAFDDMRTYPALRRGERPKTL